MYVYMYLFIYFVIILFIRCKNSLALFVKPQGNDHPTCPTFLQLYKILSVYSIIKPPKFGNCTISEDIPPPQILSLQKVKDIYVSKKGKSATYKQHIKQKLDDILEYNDWEADDIIEHTNCDHVYAMSQILDCIIYYVTGILLSDL